MIEVVLTVLGTALTATGVFSGIYYKRQAIEGKKWTDVNKHIDQLSEKVNVMGQTLHLTEERIKTVEKDTAKLESSVEKKLDRVIEQVDKLQNLLIEKFTKKE